MTPALSFCFHSHTFRPSILAAIRSAGAANPEARTFVYCDAESIRRYQPYLPSAIFDDLGRYLEVLHTRRLEVAAQKMRALVLQRHGGWYLDAFDTLTLRPLPQVERFTLGEECWDAGRRCTGVCASPPGSPFTTAWLEAMRQVPDEAWNHWTDQLLCNQLIDSRRYAVDTLPTGRLNWPSESGFTGELRLCEDQISWLLENAWVIHYFGRGALGVPYKEMDLALLQRCRELDGWLPRRILAWCESREQVGPGGPAFTGGAE